MVRSLALLAALLVVVGSVWSDEPVRAGFATADITPKVDGDQPVWIAGYGQNRKATGVHDPLYVRTVVIESGGKKVALVAVDVVGLQFPVIERIRTKLPDYFLLVASTHNHEGPDVIGLWGPSTFKNGVDPAFIANIEAKVVETVQAADKKKQVVKARFGTARGGPALLRDSRPPQIHDDVFRALEFLDANDKPIGLVVAWGIHPESLGSKNTLLTADFPHATVAALEKKHGCPAVYFSGAVGGLMTTPRTVPNPAGGVLHEENFEYCKVYGELVADVGEKAIASAEPIALSPIRVSTQLVALPLGNPAYHMLWMLNVLQRDAYEWTGDPYRPGNKLDAKTDRGKKGCLKTEVTYVRLGDLHLVGIPGELYPELLFGQYQEPVEPNADFKDAPLEVPIAKLTPENRLFYIGLANDEVGYIIPKRQWDWAAPYCYGSKERLYGEINSVGSETAPLLMKALADAIDKASSQP